MQWWQKCLQERGLLAKVEKLVERRKTENQSKLVCRCAYERCEQAVHHSFIPFCSLTCLAEYFRVHRELGISKPALTILSSERKSVTAAELAFACGVSTRVINDATRSGRLTTSKQGNHGSNPRRILRSEATRFMLRRFLVLTRQALWQPLGFSNAKQLAGFRSQGGFDALEQQGVVHPTTNHADFWGIWRHELNTQLKEAVKQQRECIREGRYVVPQGEYTYVALGRLFGVSPRTIRWYRAKGYLVPRSPNRPLQSLGSREISRFVRFIFTKPHLFTSRLRLAVLQLIEQKGEPWLTDVCWDKIKICIPELTWLSGIHGNAITKHIRFGLCKTVRVGQDHVLSLQEAENYFARLAELDQAQLAKQKAEVALKKIDLVFSER